MSDRHGDPPSSSEHTMGRRGALRLGAAVEVLIGIALIFVPGAVIKALIGVSSTNVDTLLGRVLGGALLALGVIGVLAKDRETERPTALGLALYNALTALILTSAGVADEASGWLLWPVVVLHTAVAAALIAVSLRRPTPPLPLT